MLARAAGQPPHCQVWWLVRVFSASYARHREGWVIWPLGMGDLSEYSRPILHSVCRVLKDPSDRSVSASKYSREVQGQDSWFLRFWGFKGTDLQDPELAHGLQPKTVWMSTLESCQDYTRWLVKGGCEGPLHQMADHQRKHQKVNIYGLEDRGEGRNCRTSWGTQKTIGDKPQKKAMQLLVQKSWIFNHQKTNLHKLAPRQFQRPESSLIKWWWTLQVFNMSAEI